MSDEFPHEKHNRIAGEIAIKLHEVAASTPRPPDYLCGGHDVRYLADAQTGPINRDHLPRDKNEKVQSTATAKSVRPSIINLIDRPLTADTS